LQQSIKLQQPISKSNFIILTQCLDVHYLASFIATISLLFEL